MLVQKELKNAYIGIPFPESIVLDKNSISLTTIGQTEQLTATIEPTLSDHSVTWSSSDTTVATVSMTGLVTCVTPGTATITATTSNGLTATCGVIDSIPRTPGVNTVAYYEFDGNLNDSSGNNRNLGTQSGTFTYGTESGGGKYIQTGSGIRSTEIAMPFNQEAYTISFYCSYSPNTHGVYGATVFDLYSSSYGSSMTRCVYYWSGIMDNELCMLDHNGVYYTPSIADSWHYYTFTFDGTNMKLYVDSNYIGSVSKWADANLTALNFKIGGVVGQNNNNFYSTAKLGNFILENKTRTSQEISDYYNATKGDYGSQTVQTFDFQNDGDLSWTARNSGYGTPSYTSGEGWTLYRANQDSQASITPPSTIFNNKTLKKVKIWFHKGVIGNYTSGYTHCVGCGLSGDNMSCFRSRPGTDNLGDRAMISGVGAIDTIDYSGEAVIEFILNDNETILRINGTNDYSLGNITSSFRSEWSNQTFEIGIGNRRCQSSDIYIRKVEITTE